jgi:transketolase
LSNIPLRDTFGDLLVELGEENERIVVLDSDLSSSTRTEKFAQKFPDRFFNMGVAEQNTVGSAMGLAISGKIPIVSGFAVFTTGRAWEFIRIAAHDNLNLKIIPTHSGFVGEDGSTHHALEDLSLMASLPNITILVPMDNNELKQMIEKSINIEGLFYIRLPRDSFPEIHASNYRLVLGKPDVLKNGRDLCLIGAGFGASLGYQSALAIEKQHNISVKVVNLSTIKPIDVKELINQVQGCKGVVVVEEHNMYCGIGSILSKILSEYNPVPMKFVGIENTFAQSGTRESLLNAYGLNENAILTRVNELIKKI